MKRKKTKFLSFLLIILVFFSGCTVSQNFNQTNTKTTISLHLKDSIIIHQISRDIFNKFINDPSYTTLQNENIATYTFTNDGEWFETWNCTRFFVEQELFDFLLNIDNVEQFISQNDINATVNEIAVFEAPHMPITVWVKSFIEHYYITINEDLNDESYTYRLYKQDEFYKKFAEKHATLLVNGEETSTAQLYCGYADVPLVAILQKLGAKVFWVNDSLALISFNGRKCYVDKSQLLFCETDKMNENLLHLLAGGPAFIYSTDKDIMVDTLTLICALSTLGETVCVTYNADDLIVNVDT